MMSGAKRWAVVAKAMVEDVGRNERGENGDCSQSRRQVMPLHRKRSTDQSTHHTSSAFPSQSTVSQAMAVKYAIKSVGEPEKTAKTKGNYLRVHHKNTRG